MPDTSPRRLTAAAARHERRLTRELWRRGVLARAVSGERRQAIADDLNVSLATIKRAIAQAIAEIPPDEPEVFFGLQFERLTKALRLANRRIEDGDLGGVHALARIALLMDRYRDRKTARAHAREGGAAHGLFGNARELLLNRVSRLPEPGHKSDPPAHETEPKSAEK